MFGIYAREYIRKNAQCSTTTPEPTKKSVVSPEELQESLEELEESTNDRCTKCKHPTK